MANIKTLGIFFIVLLAMASFIEMYPVELETTDLLNDDDSSEVVAKRGGYWDKRNCYCRTYLTAKNSKFRGRLSKHCTCYKK